jgi:hypothetical protein
MIIQIRLIESPMQLTKFQIFQRTLLDFNGTTMLLNFDLIYRFTFFLIKVQ